jgi:hypothetical protein
MTTYEEVCLLAALEEIWKVSLVLTERETSAIMSSSGNDIYPLESNSAGLQVED